MYDFKSIYRTINPGEPYPNAAEVLNAEVEAGWELHSVSWVAGVFKDVTYEVFYLRKPKGTVP